MEAAPRKTTPSRNKQIVLYTHALGVHHSHMFGDSHTFAHPQLFCYLTNQKTICQLDSD